MDAERFKEILRHIESNGKQGNLDEFQVISFFKDLTKTNAIYKMPKKPWQEYYKNLKQRGLI
jgi:chorismate mutase